jgi:hypothetical protein
MLNEGNQIHNFISSSGSGTVINYGSGSDFLTSYGSGSIFCRSFALCFLTRFRTYKKIFTTPNSNLGGEGGPQTDKHLPQSPFTGQFFRY